MSDDTTLGLLREALDLLNDRPNFGLRRDPRTTSYALAARIDRHLAALLASTPDAAVVQQLRERWARSGVLIDPGETETRRTPLGRWIRAWVLFDLGFDPSEGPLPAIDVEDFRAAVMALPDDAREAFLLHCRDSMAYRDIAASLGISVADVERRVAAAMAQLMRAFRADENP